MLQESRHSFNNNTMNDGTKLSAQTSFMEKRALQRWKSPFMKLTGLQVAQALTKKDFVRKPVAVKFSLDDPLIAPDRAGQALY